MPNNSQSISKVPVPASEIKKALIDRKLTVSDLARKLKKSRSAVSQAIHHTTLMPALRQKIERSLELTNA